MEMTYREHGESSVLDFSLAHEREPTFRLGEFERIETGIRRDLVGNVHVGVNVVALEFVQSNVERRYTAVMNLVGAHRRKGRRSSHEQGKRKGGRKELHGVLFSLVVVANCEHPKRRTQCGMPFVESSTEPCAA